MKTIEQINQHNVKKILSEKKIPDFFPGDVVKVGVRQQQRPYSFTHPNAGPPPGMPKNYRGASVTRLSDILDTFTY